MPDNINVPEPSFTSEPLPVNLPENVVLASLPPTDNSTADEPRFVRLNVPDPARPWTTTAVNPEATFTVALSVKVPEPIAVRLPRVKVPALTVVPPL